MGGSGVRCEIVTLWREGCGEGRARTCRSRHVAAREGELISREEELVDLRLRVAAADDEIQVRVAGLEA